MNGSVSSSSSRLPWRTALITGASAGIGRALALRLARDGVHVVVAARRLNDLEALVEEIRRTGGSAEAVAMDVRDQPAAIQAIKEADTRTGGLDLVVANAGIGGSVSAKRMTWADANPMLQVNLLGAIATLTAVLPEQVARGRGHVVGISSIASYRGLPGASVYSCTKAGLTTFLEAIRLDLASTGVKVTAVHPGYVLTDMTAKNKGKLPFSMSAEAAADLMVRKLVNAPARLDFPLPTVLAMTVVKYLPGWLFDRIIRWALR